MNIELKKVKIFLPGSEETICFTADIYVDGKLAGYAKNDGNGGMTFCGAYKDTYDLLKSAEQYCDNLPAKKMEMDLGNGKKRGWKMKMALDHFVDDLIDIELGKIEDKKNKKSQERFVKKMEQLMATSLIFTFCDEGKPIDSYTPVGWTKYTLEQVASDYKGVMTIKKFIIDYSAKGMRVINTNIPEEILSDLRKRFPEIKLPKPQSKSHAA